MLLFFRLSEVQLRPIVRLGNFINRLLGDDDIALFGAAGSDDYLITALILVT